MRNVIFVVSLIGCVPATSPSGVDEARGTWMPSGKADDGATCAGYCGGRSPGRCYCDVACSGWGDRCPDYQNVCSADRPDLAGSGTTGWGGYDAGWGGYDAGWGGYDGGTSGTSGGTSGGSFDLAGPSYDAGFTQWDLAQPGDLAPVSVWFSDTLTVTRDWYYNGAFQSTTTAYVYVSCAIAGGTIGCGLSTVALGSGGSFIVQTIDYAQLTGQVITPQTVDFYSYSYTSQPDGNGWQYNDHWTGFLSESTKGG